MFKFPLYIALCAVLVFYSAATAANPKLEVLGEGTYAIYSREDIQSPLITRRVSSGIGYIYYTDSKNVSVLRTRFDSIDGESIQISGESAKEIFRKLGYNEVSSSGDIYYGYSSRGLAFIKSGGQKINLQISERNGMTTVGWPVILGSY